MEREKVVKFNLQIDIHVATKRQCSNCIKQGHIESSWSQVVGWLVMENL